MTLSLYSRCDVGTGIYVPPAPANKNWNPGDWIASGTDGVSQDAIWDKSGTIKTRGILQRLAAIPQYRGAMLRYSWDQLERNEGEYEWTETINNIVYKRGMAQIQERLDQIAGYEGRRLIIFIQMKTFGSGNHAAPKYIREDLTGIYEDGTNYFQTSTPQGGSTTTLQGSLSGEYAYVSARTPPGPGGYVPNMHVDAVRDRFIAMMTEFANRFNSHQCLEAIAFTEASIASPAGSEGLKNQTYPANPNTQPPTPQTVVTRPNSNTPATWPDLGDWFTNMTAAFVSMRSSLSNIQICQWVNSDRNDMEPWVPDILAAGIGVGMPDFCKDERGFNITRSTSPAGAPGNIYWMNQSPTNAIRMTHMSVPAMEGSVVTESQTVDNAAPGQYAFHGLDWTRLQAAGFATTVVPTTHRLWRHATNNQELNTSYSGQNFNEVTDNAIASIVATYPLEGTPRPTGW